MVVTACLALILSAPVHAFDLQGHRGARGLAPENTLAAFRAALAIGVTTLETDLSLTKDGVLVLTHEPRLSAALTRGPDGTWLKQDGAPFSELSYEEVERYDVGRLNAQHDYAARWPEQRPVDGERIPRLTSLFELARERRSPGESLVHFNIETKVTPGGDFSTAGKVALTQAVIAAVRHAGLADRVTVQSFDWATLVETRRSAPDIFTSCLSVESTGMNTVRPGQDGASPWHAGLKLSDHGGSVPRLARAAGCSTWSPFWRNVTQNLVTEAHELGLRVIPWTVNDPAEMERMIELRVDGLITDYPDRASRVLAAKGVPIE